MKYKVIFRDASRDEAVEAARYIAEHVSADVALKWYAGLVAAIDSLAQWPNRCPLARENELISGVTLRQLNYHSHRLIFTVADRVVHVLAVRHVARGISEFEI